MSKKKIQPPIRYSNDEIKRINTLTEAIKSGQSITLKPKDSNLELNCKSANFNSLKISRPLLLRIEGNRAEFISNFTGSIISLNKEGFFTFKSNSQKEIAVYLSAKYTIIESEPKFLNKQ